MDPLLVKYFSCSLCDKILLQPIELPCHHVYCKQCLEDSQVHNQELKCKKCGSKFNLQNGVASLPTNNSLENLVVRLIAGAKASMVAPHPECTECEENTAAISVCLDCNEYFCHPCNEHHRTVRKKHEVQLLKDSEKSELKTLRCAEHNKKTSLYCWTCDCLICETCAANSNQKHGDHQREDFAAILPRCREWVRLAIEGAQQVAKEVSDVIGDIKRTQEALEESRKKARQLVEDGFQDALQKLNDEKERQVVELEKIHDAKRTSLASQLEQCEHMEKILASHLECSNDVCQISEAGFLSIWSKVRDVLVSLKAAYQCNIPPRCCETETIEVTAAQIPDFTDKIGKVFVALTDKAFTLATNINKAVIVAGKKFQFTITCTDIYATCLHYNGTLPELDVQITPLDAHRGYKAFHHFQAADQDRQADNQGDQAVDQGGQADNHGDQTADQGGQADDERGQGDHAADQDNHAADQGNEVAFLDNQAADLGNQAANQGNQDADHGNQAANQGNQAAGQDNQAVDQGNQAADQGNQAAADQGGNADDHGGQAAHQGDQVADQGDQGDNHAKVNQGGSVNQFKLEVCTATLGPNGSYTVTLLTHNMGLHRLTFRVAGGNSDIMDALDILVVPDVHATAKYVVAQIEGTQVVKANSVAIRGKLCVYTDKQRNRICNLVLVKPLQSNSGGYVCMGHDNVPVSPEGIAIDLDNSVIIADKTNRRVLVMKAKEPVFIQYLTRNGGQQFDGPTSIAVNRNGRIFIGDSTSIQYFNPDYNHAGEIRNWDDKMKGTVDTLSIAVDAQDNLLVVSQKLGKVYVLKEDNNQYSVVHIFGNSILGPNRNLKRPVGIATDGRYDYIYIIECDRLCMFSSEGECLACFDKVGEESIPFRNLSGISVTKEGSVILADGGSLMEVDTLHRDV